MRRALSFPVLVTALLGGVCVFLARTTFDLDVPFDVDLFRDIAQADGVRRGRLFADANYVGEQAWYNPLGGWLVAIGSRLTGGSVTAIVTRGGVFLNLISPIGLTLLVRQWFGRAAAGFALVGYVFLLCGNYPSWAVATYSPWMFPANYAQGLFFLALLAELPAFETRLPVRAALLGALIGVVTLAHTAPAIVLAVICVVVALRRRDVVTLAIAGVVGGVVASPFLLPLLVSYRFDVRNELPTDWVWTEIRARNILRFAWEFGTRWPVLVGLAALAVWMLERRRRRPAAGELAEPSEPGLAVLTTWTVVAAAMLVVAIYGSSSIRGSGAVPDLVPSYHFLLYLTAALCVWFGVAMAAVARAAATRLPPTVPFRAVCAAMAAVLMIAAAPTWIARDERRDARDTSFAIVQAAGGFGASHFIAESTPEDAVILYDLESELSVELGALDGRRTVVVNQFFSNPYVDWQVRADAAQSMIGALGACDLAAFGGIAAPYGVGYVVTSATDDLAALPERCPWVEAVYADSVAVVLALIA